MRKTRFGISSTVLKVLRVRNNTLTPTRIGDLWYDNEWGYSNRVVDLVRYISKK